MRGQVEATINQYILIWSTWKWSFNFTEATDCLCANVPIASFVTEVITTHATLQDFLCHLCPLSFQSPQPTWYLCVLPHEYLFLLLSYSIFLRSHTFSACILLLALNPLRLAFICCPCRCIPSSCLPSISSTQQTLQHVLKLPKQRRWLK